MTTCPTCGFENQDRDFCEKCGEYLRWDERTGSHQAVAPPRAPGEPPTVELAPSGELAPGVPVTPSAPVLVTLRASGDAGSAGGAVSTRVEPGGEAMLRAVVRNQSGVVDNYDLRMTGWPEGWWTITPATVHLLPWGSSDGGFEQEVLIRLHPPRSPQAEGRPWAVSLAAVSRTQRAVVASAAATVEIAPYEQFEIRVRPERARGERAAEYALTARNLGNAAVSLDLRGEDPDDDVTFAFDPAGLTVAPGGEALAAVRVSAHRPREAERERRLTIHAYGSRDTRAATVSFVQRPLVTPRRVTGVRVLLTLLASGMLIAGSFMAWTADGLTALCVGGPDACLRYDAFLDRNPDLGLDIGAPSGLGGLENLFSFGTSLGIVTLLLGLIVLLGVRRGGAAWFGGIVSILYLVGYLIVGGDSGAGVWVALLGGVLAVVSGIMATLNPRS